MTKEKKTTAKNKVKTVKRGRGHPRKDFAEQKEKVLELIASGYSVVKISRMDDMPSQSQIYRWEDDDPEYWERYKKARIRQADYFADTVIDISDETHARAVSGDLNNFEVAAANHRTFNYKWRAAILAPKKYGKNVEEGSSENDRVSEIKIIIEKPVDLRVKAKAKKK